MSYKIESLKVRNFKCFDNKKFYEFYFSPDTNPAILSGPNGFGKTTFFDAIELIFTKRITRLNSDIEDGRTNLGKNILLNTSDMCGYLILKMTNERNEKLTFIAKINNSLTKLNIDVAIKITCIEGSVDSEKFDDFLNGDVDWKDDISQFDKINYIKEHFNIYYYVSQAESIHFLKNSISSRKDSMTKLLQTEAIQENVDKIERNLIGASKTKNGVLINDDINATRRQLEAKIADLRRILKEAGGIYKESKYTSLLVYPQNSEKKVWDLENLELRDVSEKQLAIFIDEINAMYYLYQDLHDYIKHQKNREIKMLVINNEAISNYARYYSYINQEALDICLIKEEIEKANRLLDVFKFSSFLRSDINISKYKKQDMISLKDLGVFNETIEIDDMDDLVIEICALTTQLGENQKKSDDLKRAREKLHSIKEYNSHKNHCPYCNSNFDNPELLESSFNALSAQLESLKDITSFEVEVRTKKLAGYVKLIIDTNMEVFKLIDDNKIDQIRAVASQYSMLLKSENEINNIVKIHRYVGDVNSWRELDETSQVFELKRIIESKLFDYENKDFTENLKLYNYENIYKENADLLMIEQIKLKNRTDTDDKIMFLKYQDSIQRNNEINQIKNEAKSYIIRLKKLEEIRRKYEILKNLYNEAINRYRNLVLNQLRVPLLIYTGKILQDYQNGLGVYINKDEMRFVSNGDAKHDILNTFSSGQLSGFVLSFLFAMNKRYISEQTDDIGFILIDDPVQTMDDINIASFIEVLRNDFPNKQIIISTHETDKENYILYKFLKYNLKGQSFNVKDNMY